MSDNNIYHSIILPSILIKLYLYISDTYEKFGISEMQKSWIIEIFFIVSTMLFSPLHSKDLAKALGNDESEYPKYVVVDKGDNKKSLIELTGLPKKETRVKRPSMMSKNSM